MRDLNRGSGERSGPGGPREAPGPLPIWEWLLRRTLPPGVVAESIIGDLREEFSADLKRLPPSKAHLRHLKKTLSISTRFAFPSSASPSTGQGPHSRPATTMNAFWHDLRQAFRLLTRRPGLTLIAVTSLGLGIGANTAIFSLVNTILLRPLPYPDSHELVEAFRIDEEVTGLNPTVERISGLWAVPYEVHRDWLEMAPVLSGGGGYAPTMVDLEDDEDSQRILGARMTSGAFQALGVQPSLGRTFHADDDLAGSTPVAVLAHGLWETRFGGDPGVLGREIRIGQTLHTVVGVMPQDFGFPSTDQRIWVSFTDDQKTSPVRNAGYMKVVARLAPGVTLEGARREMDQVSTRIGEAYPDEAEHRVGLFPLKAVVVGSRGVGLLILLGAVMLVLLIACTNIAGLFLIRATERGREIGVRRALGAGGRRIVFQQLSEGLILSALGAAAGWGLAMAGMEPLLALMPRELPRIGEMRVDEGLLVVAMGFALLTGILTGILPALRVSRTPITSVLNEGGRSLSGGRSRNRMHAALVVSQVALAFVLLTGAGLFIRSMTSLLAVDPGFNTSNLALLNIDWPSSAESWDDGLLFFQELEDRIRSLPGVVGVGSADQMPFSGGWSSPPVTLETTEGIEDRILHLPTVSPSYLSAMEIPLLAGRSLSPDDGAEGEPVAVISQALARQMASEGSPLGLRIRLNAPGDSIWRTVVGVVADVRYRLDFGPQSMAYVPLSQAPSFMDNWVIRTSGDPLALGPSIRQILEEMDPEGSSRYRLLDDEISSSYAVVSARFAVILLGGLAALAAGLAVFGVYGVLAYAVQLQSREIGIQMALGAEGGKVLGQVLRRGLAMGGVGFVLGLALTLGLGRFAESQLFGVEAWDLPSLAAAGGLLLVATVMASYLPARRAAGMDPVQVLKGD